MAKDSLARGAKSAQFATVNGEELPTREELNRRGIVALEEKADSEESWQATEALLTSARHRSTIDNFKPFLDRVLVRRVAEESTSLIAQPDAFRRKPTKGVVLAVGTGMVVSGQLIPIPLKGGETVYFGEYGPEEIEIDGEKLTLVSAFDIRGIDIATS